MATTQGGLVPALALPTFSSGSLLLQSDLNALPAHVLDLYTELLGGWRTQKPMGVIRCPEGFAVPNITDTVVSFASGGTTTDDMWAVNQPNQLTVNTPGWWRIVLQLHWDAVVTGARACKILVNGVDPSANAIAADARVQGTANEGSVLACEALAHLTAGSAIYGNAWQHSGGTRTLVNTWSGTFLAAEWVCP